MMTLLLIALGGIAFLIVLIVVRVGREFVIGDWLFQFECKRQVLKRRIINV